MPIDRLSTDVRLLTLSFLPSSDIQCFLSTNRSWNQFRTNEGCCRLLYRLVFGAADPLVDQQFGFTPSTTWHQRFDVRVQTKRNMYRWEYTARIEERRISRVQLRDKYFFQEFWKCTSPPSTTASFTNRSIERPMNLTIPVPEPAGLNWGIDLARRFLIVWTQTNMQFNVFTFAGLKVASFQEPCFANCDELYFSDGQAFIGTRFTIYVYDYLDAKRECIHEIEKPIGFAHDATVRATDKYIVVSYDLDDEDDPGHRTNRFNCHTLLLQRNDRKLLGQGERQLPLLDHLGCATNCIRDRSGNLCIVEEISSYRSHIRFWIVDRGSFVQIPVPEPSNHWRITSLIGVSPRFVAMIEHHEDGGLRTLVYDFMPRVQATGTEKRPAKRQRSS